MQVVAVCLNLSRPSCAKLKLAGGTMRLFLFAVVASILFPDPGRAMDIFGCGQEVPPRETGTLQAELVCTSSAVFLGERSTLLMNGHTIAGGGVFCTGHKCTIEGPGAITGAGSCGLESMNRRLPFHLFARDVDIHDNRCGIFPGRLSTLTFTNVQIRNQIYDGISGIDNRAVARVFGTGITVSGNGGVGIHAARVVLRGSTIQGNGGIGILGVRGLVELLDSTTVTGNDLVNGLDVGSRRRPHVVDSTCGKSAKLPPRAFAPDPTMPWGVCTAD
jgi:hypothetical protein